MTSNLIQSNFDFIYLDIKNKEFKLFINKKGAKRRIGLTVSSEDYSRYKKYRLRYLSDGRIYFTQNNKKVFLNYRVKKRSLANEGYIYCIKDINGNLKIGKARNPEKRLKTLQTANPDKLVLCFSIKTKYLKEAELQIHNYLKSFRKYGEWFGCALNKAREAFNSVEDAVWV